MYQHIFYNNLTYKSYFGLYSVWHADKHFKAILHQGMKIKGKPLSTKTEVFFSHTVQKLQSPFSQFVNKNIPYNPHSLVSLKSLLNRIKPKENFHCPCCLNPPPSPPQSKMSLKCLAAQSIRKYNLDYQGQVTTAIGNNTSTFTWLTLQVPKSLENFIHMHGP